MPNTRDTCASTANSPRKQTTVFGQPTQVQTVGVMDAKGRLLIGDRWLPTVLPTTAGKITSSEAQWTFSYLNNTIPAAGTYGGANLNNGRVTYTASLP